MRKKSDKILSLVEALPDGEWAVRWDFVPERDEEGNETGIYSYEEEVLYHIPQLDEVKEMITAWHNKQVDGSILQGCRWNDIPVWLSMENQFNYKSVFDLAAMTEPQVQAWDAANPDKAGKDYIVQTVTGVDGEIFEMPVSTGRPKSVLPAQFKFGTDDEPVYHTFTTLDELAEFYTYTMAYIQGCYTAGWQRKDTFDYSPYEEAIAAL